MTGFEAGRALPADADTVFVVVPDLGRLTEWVPRPVARPVHGEHNGGGEHEVHAAVPERHVDARGEVQVPTAQMRLDRAGDGGHGYAGWLQVTESDPERASVTLHLSFPDRPAQDHAPAEEVRRWLDDSLDRLEPLIAQRAV